MHASLREVRSRPVVFAELSERAIRRYQNRTIEAAQVVEGLIRALLTSHREW